MRYAKIQLRSKEVATNTCKQLCNIGVKHAQLESAVILLSNMYVKDDITNIMYENKGHEVEPTDYDIKVINGEIVL